MSFGLFGQLSTENATVVSCKQDVVDDVLADTAYAEIAEIAHEADMQAASMSQAMVIADQLDAQALATESMMQQPELVNPATVVLARESMNMALLALGAEADTTLSTESMQSSPLQAMEVTQEGIKEVSKKIYESILAAFVKMGQAIKKLVAKVIVAVTNIEKKAESLYSKYKDKQLKQVTKLESSTIADTYSSMAGIMYVKEHADGLGSKSSVQEVADLLSNNVKAIVGLSESLTYAMEKAVPALSGVLDAAKASQESSDPLSIDSEAVVEAVKGVLGDALKQYVVIPLSGNNLPEDAWAGLGGFVPTYIKNSTVYGIVIYLKSSDGSLDNLNIESFNDIKNAVGIKNFSYDVNDDSGFQSELEKPELVLSKSEIMADFKSGFKGANASIKTVSGQRNKDMDAITRQVKNHASGAKGMTLLNKLAASEYNKIRIFATGHFINQIFSIVNMYKSRLAVDVKLIKNFYTEA